MKKTLIFSALILLLSCLFAVSISASGAESNEYGTLTTIEGASEPSVIDTTSRVVIEASDGTYYTFPAYYILADNAIFTWKQNAEVSTILGYSQSSANNDFRTRVVRMELPEGITAINPNANGGAYAFEDAKKMIEITFPTTLAQVGNYSFNRCNSLATINGASEFFARATKIGVLSFAYTSWGEGFDLVIPTQITSIPNECFRGAKISSVTFHDSITEIGSCAFQSCSSLTSVTLPSSLVNLKNHAFASCTGITSIDMSKCTGLKEIGKYCFEYTKITSFDFSPFAKSLTSIGEGLFNNCSSLSTVTGYENVDCAQAVGENMFRNCALTDIKLPKNIASIGQYALYSFDGTGPVDIPDTVTSIGSYAFGSSKSLASISLPTSLVSLSNHVFENCSSLATVSTEGCTSLESIGKYCFEKAGITAFDFTPMKSSLNTMETGAFNTCSKLTSITGFDLVENLTAVPDNAFQYSPIAEILVPKNTVTIGSRAYLFHKSTQSELRLPNTVTTIGDHAFTRSGSGGQGAKIYLSASLTTISADYTFEDWCFSELYIPAGVTAIPKGMVNRCLQAGVVFYYTGDKNGFTIDSTSNEALLNAEWISVDDFTGASSEKNYIVYNYNLCDAFYYGEHNLAEGTGTNKFTGESYITSYVCEGPCSRSCGKNAVNLLCGPLFTNKGYSKVADGSMFTYGISINEENIKTYKSKTGNTFSYGFIVGAVPTTPTGNIIDVNGNALIEKSLVVDFAAVQFSNFTIYNVKMCDIDTTQQTMPVYCCAYIIDGSQVSYIGNSVTTVAASISSSTIEVIETTTTTPTTGEEENA